MCLHDDSLLRGQQRRGAVVVVTRRNAVFCSYPYQMVLLRQVGCCQRDGPIALGMTVVSTMTRFTLDAFRHHDDKRFRWWPWARSPRLLRRRASSSGSCRWDRWVLRSEDTHRGRSISSKVLDSGVDEGLFGGIERVLEMEQTGDQTRSQCGATSARGERRREGAFDLGPVDQSSQRHRQCSRSYMRVPCADIPFAYNHNFRCIGG